MIIQHSMILPKTGRARPRSNQSGRGCQENFPGCDDSFLQCSIVMLQWTSLPLFYFTDLPLPSTWTRLARRDQSAFSIQISITAKVDPTSCLRSDIRNVYDHREQCNYLNANVFGSNRSAAEDPGLLSPTLSTLHYRDFSNIHHSR